MCVVLRHLQPLYSLVRMAFDLILAERGWRMYISFEGTESFVEDTRNQYNILTGDIICRYSKMLC